jgi:hypothetical protein
VKHAILWSYHFFVNIFLVVIIAPWQWVPAAVLMRNSATAGTPSSGGYLRISSRVYTKTNRNTKFLALASPCSAHYSVRSLIDCYLCDFFRPHSNTGNKSVCTRRSLYIILFALETIALTLVRISIWRQSVMWSPCSCYPPIWGRVMWVYTG